MRLQALFLLAVLGLSFAFAPTAFGHGSGEKPPGSLLLQKASGEKMFPDPGSFVNYEIPHVHPLDLNPSATLLAACNTPDGMVEIYSVDGSGNLTHSDSIRVGYAPVSARFRTDNELWVVNHISDTISIVDISKGQEVDVIQTYDGYDGTHAGDEPADVVFTNSSHALVSGSRSDVIQRYDATTGNYVSEFRLDGEDPRMLATNAAGSSVYAAIFESGNGTTSINRTAIGGGGLYSGQNPPFNNGIPGNAWVADGMAITPGDFTAAGSPQPPAVTLIVRKDAGGAWRDDNGADWTQWVSGASAGLSGRVVGWDLLDNDIAVLTDADAFTTATYATRLMNHVMAVAVNPANGEVFAVGTEATNEIRFEPNITGTFTRVMLAITDASGSLQHLVDLNEEHLAAVQGGTAYSTHSVAQSERDKSIGDPRGIAFKPGTSVAYISGMGSNNVVAVDTTDGERFSLGHNIDLGTKQGPTGIVHHPTEDRLYVLNKFGGNVKVINTSTLGSETVIATKTFFDPTPQFINDGRVHLYDTHESSGLGQIACASCHVDARMDRLAWDLGNPAGGDTLGVEHVINTVDILTGQAGVSNFHFTNPHGVKMHTMKGPMTTQTLQDIIQHEPFHWRGDRDGLEEFAGAFEGLQGDDGPLDAEDMQDYEDFLSTVHFPPNPFRQIDNSLPGGPQFFGGGTNPDLPLPGIVSPGDISGKADSFSAAGTPLPNGDAWQGFDDYVDKIMDGPFTCVVCHALPMGSGAVTTQGGTPIPEGPLGEAHVASVTVDGTGQEFIKIPQLRNQIDKEGFFTNQFLAAPFDSRAGFGTVHNGELAGGLGRFLGSSVFETFTDQELADIIAFTLCINGDGFDDLFALGTAPSGSSPDGGPVNTAHAAIGHQVTITSGVPPMADQDTIDLLVTLADQDKVGLIATGAPSGDRASWYHVSGTGGGATFQTDTEGTTIALSSLQGLATSANPITFMAVPAVSDERMGVDRDEDSLFNAEELDLNSNSKNPDDVKWIDSAAGSGGDGSESNPYNSILAGLLTLQRTPGKNGVLRLEAGNYPSGTISAPRTILKAENGVVRFGL